VRSTSHEAVHDTDRQCLRQIRTFVSLDLKPGATGGTLQMRGQSTEQTETGVQSLPLYPFARWTITPS
jgi:hypothetical protein